VLQFLAHPQHPYEPKKNNWKNKNKKTQQMESVRMINAVHREHDHQLKSPYLIKKDDPSVPTIKCIINRSSFQKAICDTGSGVNIMAKVTLNIYMVLRPWNLPMRSCRWQTKHFTSWMD
jgi:hypothetical protein